jgi:hypothetical protein
MLQATSSLSPSKRKKVESLDVPAVPLNFLLTCSESHLGEYELKVLADVANARQELLEVLDRLVEHNAQAAVVRWFRGQDREEIKRALDNPVDVIAVAKEQIRDGQRGEEELIPRPLLPPGSAHIAASLRYQKRNLAAGKCRYCPKPQDPASVELCTEHLRAARMRYKPKNARGAEPGSIGWLHGEGFESQHGRQPGTLQSLALNRQKKTRAILAEAGLPLGSAATALQAAKDELLRHIPQSENDGLMAWELFDKAGFPASMHSTAKHALLELVSAEQVQRIGKGGKGDPFLYFAFGDSVKTKRKLSPKSKNDVLLKILSGEEVARV